MKLVCQGGDDAEVAAASPQVPVELLVTNLMSGQQKSTLSERARLVRPRGSKTFCRQTRFGPWGSPCGYLLLVRVPARGRKRVCTICTPWASDRVVVAPGWAGLRRFPEEPRIMGPDCRYLVP
jgi:hypothetical protein